MRAIAFGVSAPSAQSAQWGPNGEVKNRDALKCDLPGIDLGGSDHEDCDRRRAGGWIWHSGRWQIGRDAVAETAVGAQEFAALAGFRGSSGFAALFKCNRQRIADYPNLANYMRELYQVPGIAATVKPRYYVLGYWSIKKLNPTGIIPKGTPVDLEAPHDRAGLAT
jgi:hypothetical protein